MNVCIVRTNLTHLTPLSDSRKAEFINYTFIIFAKFLQYANRRRIVQVF